MDISQCVVSTCDMDTLFIMWSELPKFFVNVTKLEEKTLLALMGEDLSLCLYSLRKNVIFCTRHM